MFVCFLICFIFFFFQAEDGIRDTSVTGVQTCALPIYPQRVLADQVIRQLLDRRYGTLRLAFQRGLAPAGEARDRKSTRLNSSHRCISYAVFCLKKKKTTEKNT